MTFLAWMLFVIPMERVMIARRTKLVPPAKSVLMLVERWEIQFIEVECPCYAEEGELIADYCKFMENGGIPVIKNVIAR